MMQRLIEIYAANSQDVDDDVYSVHKICQCVVDDELFARTGIEPEVLEIFSYLNKQKVNETRNNDISDDRQHGSELFGTEND